MTELTRGELLHAAYALLVEKLHVVAGVAVKEIVGAHTQPKQVQFLVGVVGIVVHTRDVGRGKRAVATEIGEHVEVRQSVEQPLVAAAREAADGTVVAVVDGGIGFLYIRYQVVDEVLAEHILSELRLRAGIHGLGEQLRRVAVGHDHDHLLRLLVGYQVVEDIIHTSHLIIYLLGVGGAADEVEHGIFLALSHAGHTSGHVSWRQVDHGMVGGAQTLRVVADIFDAAMGHVPDVVGQRAVLRLDFQQAVLESLVGEIERVFRVHHAHTIDDEAVGVHVGCGGTESCRPQSCGGIAAHLVAAGELHIHHHALGRVVLVIEGHRAVVVTHGRGLQGGGLRPHRRCQGPK